MKVKITKLNEPNRKEDTIPKGAWAIGTGFCPQKGTNYYITTTSCGPGLDFEGLLTGKLTRVLELTWGFLMTDQLGNTWALNYA